MSILTYSFWDSGINGITSFCQTAIPTVFTNMLLAIDCQITFD